MKVIHTPKAPAPIGPYNQAKVSGNLVFVSGQIAIVPSSGEIIQSGVADEAKQVMMNIQAILEAAGTTFDKVIKTTIFLRTMDDFQTVNEIYGAFFGENAPARETVAVSGLPKNVHVEISCIAEI